jgi:hypothetical protein
MGDLANRPQNKNFGDRAGRPASKNKSITSQTIYYLNPKLCKYCNTQLPYDKRTNNYCNSSCAASNNNSMFPRKSGPIPKPKKVKPVNMQCCVTCNSEFRCRNPRHIYCSVNCNPKTEIVRYYRTACKFKLNKNDHPELFNSELISRYGWYNSTNRPGVTNLTGVTWDHLYRISDGFKNNISIEIMNHPANAELVPWIVNKNRKVSQITLIELHERIKMWEAGNRMLPRFLTE